MTVVNYQTGDPLVDRIQRLAEMQPAAAWLRVVDQTTNTKRPYWGKARLAAVLTDEVRASIIASLDEPVMLAVTTHHGFPVILIRTRKGSELLTVGQAVSRIVKRHNGYLIVDDATKPARRAIEAGR